MAIAKINFLWYEKGDKINEKELKENAKAWLLAGLITEDITHNSQSIKKDDSKKVISLENANETVIDRVKDFVEDVMDDGKRNYSNRKKKSKKSRK